MEKKKYPRLKDLNFMQRRDLDRLCASFVYWLFVNHYEEISPLLEQWKEEVE